MFSRQVLEWVDVHALFVAMYLNCTAQVESRDDARSRRLRVLHDLRKNNDPHLWGSVSALILDDGKLDLRYVVTSADAEILKWCLTWCAGQDLRQLL